ncbi:Modification methylase XhoI [Candidatus Nitrospira nitrosa]|uniref:site-specific DNA-methyltransferase (adenine-specific) n=1 Tax=Candidatus Nitrospira nitrosa TaxID=1742972 RepID=A0A0S4LE92_9BACT|nr:Eco57I restriction-modification methylase domain-containing protein [Candidatus Nitrospira nitrosa]CUS35953.1 Modification methylase XhoI [Candidatus Nitrospira nitrosa]
MANNYLTPAVSTRGIQLPLLAPVRHPLPISPTESKGVVYTKRWVVELLLDLSGYRSDENLVDRLAIEPAAGDGAFLGPMIERLLMSCQKHGRSLSDCQRSLLAYELDENSAARAHAAAQATLIHHGTPGPQAKELADAWVQTRDYLLDADHRQADFIIGNPPYVRLEDIPEETASVYRSTYPTMRGRADLYVAFFEAALRQLKPNGVCSFICADRWMRNQYGAELRQLISSAYSVEILLSMHHANAFDDDVDAYPAITVIRCSTQQSTIVASANHEAEHVQPGQLAATLKTHNRTFLPQGIHRAVVKTWFKGSAPWPCHSPEQLALLRRLEDQFPPLELSARVGIGVATGHDRIYITTDPELVESSRLLKLALAKDLTAGTVRWSGHYLVNPWKAEGLVDLRAYPKLQAYYEHHAAALKKRHTAEKSADKWYKTIDRVNHTLTHTHKLYIPDIKNALEPVLDRGETYPHHNLYFIQSDVWDLEVLGGLLLSKVGQFFVESYGVRMRGGYLRFQAQYLRRIRVPAPQALPTIHSLKLREAFRLRDKTLATIAALDLYEIDARTMEAALEH